jgi:hypothetical protein
MGATGALGYLSLGFRRSVNSQGQGRALTKKSDLGTHETPTVG